jgi:putative ABC transport system ATP-binding protein
LDGVDLDVKRGECVFLLGPSGSGKTTLLSIVGCVLQADAGRVEVLGRNIPTASTNELTELRRRQIGFVFQRFHLIRGLTALENVCVPLLLDDISSQTARRRGLELLELLDLSHKAKVQPAQMSVGECQRVALARALAANPPIILADEPTASIDAESGQRVMQLLRRVTVECGKTAIVVTHDSRILPFADRILSMERGRIMEVSSSPSQV